jgi:hypothetical protein
MNYSSGNSEEHAYQNGHSSEDLHVNQTIALIPSRLGAPVMISWPSELRAVTDVALAWQKLGASASFWEIGGAPEGRLHEMAGCMASIGEQLGLASTAELEYRSWQEMQKVDNEIAAEMAKRSMAELASHYLVAIGHGLFNLTCRAVALDHSVGPALERRFRTDFPAYSEKRSDWRSMNKRGIKDIESVAAESNLNEIREMISPTSELFRSQEWTDLDNSRGEDFHRRRIQSAGMLGASRGSPWTSQSGVRSMNFGGVLIGPEGLAKLAADTLAIGSKARTRILVAMENFERCLKAALLATTQLEID